MRAAESVRVAFTNGSDIPIALITNAAFMTREKVFSKVIVWNETQVLDKSLRLRIKIQAMCESPFERTLFLDTDTMVLEVSRTLFLLHLLHPLLSLRSNSLQFLSLSTSSSLPPVYLILAHRPNLY